MSEPLHRIAHGVYLSLGEESYTPNGSRILVRAMPPPPTQNAGVSAQHAPTASSSFARSSTPEIAHDTFDLGTPPQNLPPLTQLPRRNDMDVDVAMPPQTGPVTGLTADYIVDALVSY